MTPKNETETPVGLARGLAEGPAGGHGKPRDTTSWEHKLGVQAGAHGGPLCPTGQAGGTSERPRETTSWWHMLRAQAGDHKLGTQAGDTSGRPRETTSLEHKLGAQPGPTGGTLTNQTNNNGTNNQLQSLTQRLFCRHLFMAQRSVLCQTGLATYIMGILARA